jgi:hypothetical protein
VPIPSSVFAMLRAESGTDPDAYERPNPRLHGCPVLGRLRCLCWLAFPRLTHLKGPFSFRMRIQFRAAWRR